MRKTAKQQLVYSDGENLGFKDNEFDFVFCNHVLEHVDNPEKFLSEMFRVGKQGYLETPSLLGEFLAPKDSHRWIVLFIDRKVVMFEKDVIGFKNSHDFGDLFLDYFPMNSIGWKLIQRTHPDIMTSRIRWNEPLEVLINPVDEARYMDLFTKPWTQEVYNMFFPEKTIGQELKHSFLAFFDVLKSVFKSKVLKKSEYTTELVDSEATKQSAANAESDASSAETVKEEVAAH